MRKHMFLEVIEYVRKFTNKEITGVFIIACFLVFTRNQGF